MKTFSKIWLKLFKNATLQFLNIVWNALRFQALRFLGSELRALDSESKMHLHNCAFNIHQMHYSVTKHLTKEFQQFWLREVRGSLISYLDQSYIKELAELV